jgi:methylglyoxal synthase
MTHIATPARKSIALVAHDSQKNYLLAWAKFNSNILSQHELFCTGTTGRLIEEKLQLEVTKLLSGPLGGDQQLGAKIVDGAIDFVIFFWDPLQSQPHDPDVKALLRLAMVWNIPIACNRASADFMFSSQLMNEPYERMLPDYQAHRERVVASLFT